MAPAHERAAEWVDVRPLRRTCTAHRGQAPRRPPPSTHNQQWLFLATDHRPPLAGVKLVRPRPRPDGRYRCGRSSLTHGRAAARTRQLREIASTTVQPDDQTAGHRVSPSHSLDNEAPWAADLRGKRARRWSSLGCRCARASLSPAWRPAILARRSSSSAPAASPSTGSGCLTVPCLAPCGKGAGWSYCDPSKSCSAVRRSAPAAH